MNDDFFTKFDGPSKSPKRNNFVVPFISGVVGTGLVIGVVFGVPSIKNKLLGTTTETSSNLISKSSNTVATQINLSDYSNTAIYASNKVLPSIVGIEVEYTVDSFGMSQLASAQGSGIILNKDGYILTNNHIISSSDSSSYYTVSEATSVKVSIYNDSNKYDAEIIGTDAQTDLAIIKITADNITPATLGNSGSLQVGEFVLAVGNPLGFQSSVSSGIVSALNRTITTEDTPDFVVIQTDCAINAGNSGGALVNSNGDVVGINTLKLSGTGIEGMGFAIPINDTINIYEDLIKYGKIRRPYIGITGVDLNQKTADYYKLPIGIYVKSIDSQSNITSAGLKTGDVITKIDGEKVETMKQLNVIKNKKNIGDTIVLTVYRNNSNVDISIKLEETP